MSARTRWTRESQYSPSMATMRESSRAGSRCWLMLNLRLADPAVLIDITRIATLDEICDLGDKIEVGAAVTQNRLLAWPRLADKLPLLAVALPFVGHFQTRNRGTVCGSVAHADPSSEIPLSLAVLEGEVVLCSQRGTRVLAAGAFQKDLLTTAREPDELIVSVRFPVMSGRGVAFQESGAAPRRLCHYRRGSAGRRQDAVRLGVGGMSGRPAVRQIAAADGSAAGAAIDKMASELEGYEDLHASAAMRRDLVRLAPVVIDEAMRCAA